MSKLSTALKKLTALALAIAVVLGFGLSGLPSANSVSFSDTESHWARVPIDRWTSKGVISGYSGNEYRPDAAIKRGELFKIIAQTMNYQYIPGNPFSDININDWYYDYILKLVGAGVVNGSGGRVRPEDNITREEAFAVFARVFRISADESGILNFPDSEDCEFWAKGEVGGLIRAGYVKGSDGYLNPKSLISRAEAVQILDNIVYGYISSGEMYSTDINGVTIINTSGAELHDMHINGDLFITQGVGDGQVILDNVIVDGDVYVTGGGENGVLIRGKSRVGTVFVKTTPATGPVRVSFSEPSEANTIAIENDSEDVFIDGIVNRVLVSRDATVYLDNTTVKSIDLNGIGAEVRVNENATAKDIRINAERTKIYTAGNVDHITVNRGADGAQIESGRSGHLVQVTSWANDANIFGTGVLGYVTVEEGTGTRVTVSGAVVEVSADAGGVKTGDAPENWIPPGETGQVGMGDTENALNVKKVTVLEDGTIQVEFSKEVDKTKAQSASNYSLTGDAVKYTADQQQHVPNYADVNGSIVKLTFTGSSLKLMKSGETAIITVSNLTAKDGSPLGIKSGIFRKASDDARLVSGKITGGGKDYTIRAVDPNVNWPDGSMSLGNPDPKLELTVTIPGRVGREADLTLEARDPMAKIAFVIKTGTMPAPSAASDYKETVFTKLSFTSATLADRVYIQVTAADGKTRMYYRLNVRVIDQPSLSSIEVESPYKIRFNFMNLLDDEKYVRFGELISTAGSSITSSAWLPIVGPDNNGVGSLSLDLQKPSDRDIFEKILDNYYIHFGKLKGGAPADDDADPDNVICTFGDLLKPTEVPNGDFLDTNTGNIYFTTHGTLMVHGLKSTANYAVKIERGSNVTAYIRSTDADGLLILDSPSSDLTKVTVRRIYKENLGLPSELGKPYVPNPEVNVDLAGLKIEPAMDPLWGFYAGTRMQIDKENDGKLTSEDIKNLATLALGSHPLQTNLLNNPGNKNIPTRFQPTIDITVKPAESEPHYIESGKILFENTTKITGLTKVAITMDASNIPDVFVGTIDISQNAATQKNKVELTDVGKMTPTGYDFSTTYDEANFAPRTAYLIDKTSISVGVPVRKWVYRDYNFSGDLYTFKNPSLYGDTNKIAVGFKNGSSPQTTIPGFHDAGHSGEALMQVDGLYYLTSNLAASNLETVIANSTAGDTFTVNATNLKLMNLSIRNTGSSPLVLLMSYCLGNFAISSDTSVNFSDITVPTTVDTAFIAEIGGYAVPFGSMPLYNVSNYNYTTHYVKITNALTYKITGTSITPTRTTASGTLSLSSSSGNVSFTIQQGDNDLIPRYEPPHILTPPNNSITITPVTTATISASSGGTLTFTAEVHGEGSPCAKPSQTVNWSLDGSPSGAYISNGILTITPGIFTTTSSLQIRATAPP
ncbi:MAG: S-layer homology domain-containing protein, partial [Oscillospiraceae bacterium]|nr:S-layer homology domain-containing protein [Oscillospiraceae bacterium]